jgi:hypothetical protein
MGWVVSLRLLFVVFIRPIKKNLRELFVKLTVLTISLVSYLAFLYKIAIDAANVKNEVLL